MRSNITTRGLPETTEFTGTHNYIYGLVDFWAFMFQDKDLLDKTLEAQSYQLSEMYSRFLQLCSSVSLFDIRSTFHSDIKLMLLDETDLVGSGLETSTQRVSFRYRLPFKALMAKFLMDKPMLPGVVLQEDVHFRLGSEGTELELFTTLGGEQTAFVSRAIRKTLTVKAVSGNLVSFKNTLYTKTYGETEVLPKVNQEVEVSVTQWSIWITDVEIDEQVVYNYFGKFVGVTPATSTDLFRDFIRGLYYLYSGGPTLDLLKRGLNLAIGLPFARQTEQVLAITFDDESGNYSVTTANNSYTIPYGIDPATMITLSTGEIIPGLKVGDVLLAGYEVLALVQIWDYRTPGRQDWWLNLAIPTYLIPSWAATHPNQPMIAVPNGEIDYYMRKYLKTHTFYVRIEAVAALATASMTEIIRHLDYAKPTHTMPIYAWAVPTIQDNLDDEEEVTILPTLTIGDMMLQGEFIKRNAGRAGERGANTWIRSNGDLTGYGGVTVVMDHEVADDARKSQAVVITSTPDTQLIPLYNAPYWELIPKLNTIPAYAAVAGLGELRPKFSVDVPTSGGDYLLWFTRHGTVPVDLEPTKQGYYPGDVGPFFLETNRCYVPDLADLSPTETLVFIEFSRGLYSVYLQRPDLTLFQTDTGFVAQGNVYFPPTEDETLTITIVP